MKKAFTLTEILIAMTIIGVVAVLTIPQLMGNANVTALKTKFRASYVSLQQGFELAASDGMPIVKWGKDKSSNEDVINDDLTPNLSKYLKIKKLTVGSNEKIKDYTNGTATEYIIDAKYKLPNGAILSFSQQAITKMKDSGCKKTETLSDMCIVFLDVNGKTIPNETVMCTTGNTSSNINEACTMNENKLHDIYPLVLIERNIKPLTNAVQKVLNE